MVSVVQSKTNGALVQLGAQQQQLVQQLQALQRHYLLQQSGMHPMLQHLNGDASTYS